MSGDETITVRLIMPDRWLEHVAELPTGMSVTEAKQLGLREMLQRSSDDPSDFYTEYLEREVVDESRSLEQIGMRPRGVLSIRAYDLGHYPRFIG
ncbi:MAG: hypothetical protein R3195_05870 [Gemmatimonadota bacterium]|nr:hypothetical protein [Gemmatimonadota bacterium]